MIEPVKTSYRFGWVCRTIFEYRPGTWFINNRAPSEKYIIAADVRPLASNYRLITNRATVCNARDSIIQYSISGGMDGIIGDN